MIDFPSPATLNQIYTAAGASWKYDGVKWISYSAGGDITSVIAGTGLNGGGTSGDVTLNLTTPVSVANGGTGSTTAGGALTNLGAASAASLANYLPLSGGTVAGATTFNGTVTFNGTTSPAWLPLTGGTLSGGLTINAPLLVNSTITVPNALWFNGKDTGGNVCNLLGMYSDNSIYVGDGNHQLNIRSGGGYAYMFAHLIPFYDNSYYCGSGGHAWNQVASYSYPGSSDRRLKTGIVPLPDDCTALVNAIQPQRFQWRKGPDPDRVHWGFIAQEVAAVMDKAGHEFGGHYVGDDEDHTQMLDVNELVAVLWSACQQLAARVEALETK